MKLVAGVDIGNSSTEVCIGEIAENGSVRFLSEAIVKTTGLKGSIDNINGIIEGLTIALGNMNRNIQELSIIKINEATPVIGSTAMETITETYVMDSAMIGHNPRTPAGYGLAVGDLIFIENLDNALQNKKYIVMADASYSFNEVADKINDYSSKIEIVGVILQGDEAVLVYNRLKNKIPIVDEVANIYKVPENKPAAIEVAFVGEGIKILSNPFGIANALDLNPAETKNVVPIAKSLIGKTSGVVIYSPYGKVTENILPAGEIYIQGKDKTLTVDVDNGAEKIMDAVITVGDIIDIKASKNTNIGNMFHRVRNEMKSFKMKDETDVKIKDILAVDTYVPVAIKGALSNEYCMEKAVGIAAMVKTNRLPMEELANKIQDKLKIFTKVSGVEAVMATLGALTTPGTTFPLAILDLGGGSTDAAVLYENGEVRSTHLAGAGELVTLLIKTELGIESHGMAELIKRYPLAKVESLYHIRLENGEIKFFEKPVSPKLFGSVVVLKENEMIRIEEDLTLERIMSVRKEAKSKVFVRNAIRGLTEISLGKNLMDFTSVVLVGGSALDFEIPQMLTQALAPYKIVCGSGHIRKTQGPRNAVATGLVMDYTG